MNSTLTRAHCGNLGKAGPPLIHLSMAGLCTLALDEKNATHCMLFPDVPQKGQAGLLCLPSSSHLLSSFLCLFTSFLLPFLISFLPLNKTYNESRLQVCFPASQGHHLPHVVPTCFIPNNTIMTGHSLVFLLKLFA